MLHVVETKLSKKNRKKKRIHSGEEGDLNRRGGKEREGEGEKEW